MTYLLIPIFFLISVIYSTVGLGGGSAYIAVMVLFGVSKATLPIIALGCNLIVAGTGFVRYRKTGFFKWDLFWPFAVTSIPFAYIGGRMHFSDKLFTGILASALILAAANMLFFELKGVRRLLGGRALYAVYSAIGAILGLLAGITGIGGGIYLIPVLVLLRLASPKEASAVASLFIVVNSASGLVGQMSKGFIDWKTFFPLALVVLVGGFIGSKMGATRLKGATLQKIVGIILLFAVARLVGIF